MRQPCIAYQDGTCQSHGDHPDDWCENCLEATQPGVVLIAVVQQRQETEHGRA